MIDDRKQYKNTHHFIKTWLGLTITFLIEIIKIVLYEKNTIAIFLRIAARVNF
jgi:hypothetical protein